MDTKQIAEFFLQLCAKGNVQQAFDEYVSLDFIHHNPYFREDAISLQQGMKQNTTQYPNKTMTIQRSIAEQNLVAIHSKLQMTAGHKGVSVVHIFKFNQDNKINELWDIGQAVPDTMHNSQGMF